MKKIMTPREWVEKNRPNLLGHRTSTVLGPTEWPWTHPASCLEAMEAYARYVMAESALCAREA